MSSWHNESCQAQLVPIHESRVMFHRERSLSVRPASPGPRPITVVPLKRQRGGPGGSGIAGPCTATGRTMRGGIDSEKRSSYSSAQRRSRTIADFRHGDVREPRGPTAAPHGPADLAARGRPAKQHRPAHEGLTFATIMRVVKHSWFRYMSLV
jgi:hypothetical protein